jgi:hypothetical protein
MPLIRISDTMTFRETDTLVIKECEDGWWGYAFIRPYPDNMLPPGDHSFETVYSDALAWCQERFGIPIKRWKPAISDLFILLHRESDAFEFNLRWC